MMNETVVVTSRVAEHSRQQLVAPAAPHVGLGAQQRLRRQLAQSSSQAHPAHASARTCTLAKSCSGVLGVMLATSTAYKDPYSVRRAHAERRDEVDAP